MKLPSSIVIGVRDLPKLGTFTVNIRHSRPLRLRLWLAIKLVGAATWLIRGNVNAKPEGEATEP